MEFKELQREIICKSINSAVCIDDDMLAPYEFVDDTTKASYQMPQCLYTSFRKEAKCDLDIYHYIDYKQFTINHSYLFNHKDLLILDWELNQLSELKYEDSIKIIEDAFDYPTLRFVVIYTNNDNVKEIMHRLLLEFSGYKKPEQQKRFTQFKTILEAFLNDNENYSSIEDFFADFGTYISEYTLSRQPRKDFGRLIKDAELKLGCSVQLTDINKQLIESGFENLKDCLHWLDFMLSDSHDLANKHTCEIIDDSTVLIEGTLVYIVNKGVVNPNQLYNRVVEKICNVPNYRSLLLSLLVNNVINKRVPTIGRGLSSISDDALLRKVESYKEENDFNGFMSFISECLSGELDETLHFGIDQQIIKDLLWSVDNKVNPNPSEKEKNALRKLNSFLTFIPKEKIKEEGKLYTGDIFEVKGSRNSAHQYLICISQGCDCTNPEKKIGYNYAFAKGEIFNNDSNLTQAEKEQITFFPDGVTAIKWLDKFQTIYLKDKNKVNKDTIIKYVCLEGECVSLYYCGRQKDHFAQRVLNSVFNHALRIGADLVILPDKKDKTRQ